MLRAGEEADFAIRFDNLVAVAAQNSGELGLTKAELDEMRALATDLRDDLVAVKAARDAYAAVVARKDARLAAAKRLAGKHSREWRAQDDVSDALLVRMGLAPKQTRSSRRRPVQPERLIATADGNGRITLTWDRAGNPRGALFLVQRADAGQEGWTTVLVTTRSKAFVMGTPGQPIWLRVIAQARNETSEPTSVAALWDDVALRAA